MLENFEKMMEEIKFRSNAAAFIEMVGLAKAYNFDLAEFLELTPEQKGDKMVDSFGSYPFMRHEYMIFCYNKEANEYEYEFFKIRVTNSKEFKTLEAAMKHFEKLAKKEANAYLNDTQASENKWFINEYEFLDEKHIVKVPAQELEQNIIDEFEVKRKKDSEKVMNLINDLRILMDKEKVEERVILREKQQEEQNLN